MARYSLLIFSFLIFLYAAAPSLSSGELMVSLQPEKAAPGQPLLIKIVNDKGISSISGRMGERPIYLFAGPEKSFYALAGLDLETKEETLILHLSVMDSTGANFELRRDIEIQPRDYGVQSLTLPRSLVELDAVTLARVKEEAEFFEQVWATLTPERLWRGGFATPVNGPITGSFGVRRLINGQERSRHAGVDLYAAEGTSVHAPARGRVALVGEFFFSGKSVVLDHGLGLFSSYFHLSNIEVKPNQEIEKGRVLGRVGKSGRATGPNLHWGVRLNGARVDPLALIRLDID